MASPSNTPPTPLFKRPNPRIADPGKVRLGDSMVTGKFPPRKPDPRTSDSGKVRLGDSMVTGAFPSRN